MLSIHAGVWLGEATGPSHQLFYAWPGSPIPGHLPSRTLASPDLIPEVTMVPVLRDSVVKLGMCPQHSMCVSVGRCVCERACKHIYLCSKVALGSALPSLVLSRPLCKTLGAGPSQHLDR